MTKNPAAAAQPLALTYDGLSHSLHPSLIKNMVACSSEKKLRRIQSNEKSKEVGGSFGTRMSFDL
jgi:hypothetical protein